MPCFSGQNSVVAKDTQHDLERHNSLNKDETMARSKKIRYAVVGIGHIAQAAVLPAFANARKNSVLTAIVSDDPVKRDEIGKQYGLEHAYSMDQYDECLRSGHIDAVYIALPNNQHCEYTVRAAEAGIHVLCEKPMAVTKEECEKMIHAAESSGVKLMVAYRLHFEEANLKAIEIAQSGQLGDLKLFNSVFNMQVRPGDIRVDRELGGGPIYDIGVYCINAARYLLRSEPMEVTAFHANTGDPRFQEVEEATGAVLRFPGDRLATFVCSFGAADVSSYQIVGTEGDLRVDPAYGYQGRLKHHLTIGEKTSTKTFSKRDQFAPELLYFSDCILNGTQPEPSGHEGLADVRVIQAIYRSAETKRSVLLDATLSKPRPDMSQEEYRPPVSEPELVHTESPSQ
jgi:predicted dehydrogenase